MSTDKNQSKNKIRKTQAITKQGSTKTKKVYKVGRGGIRI